jgi:endonuclease I
LFLRENALSSQRMEEELDLLEAALPYNCEHVVPQSWFGKREPMRGDLHHLFACETRCNSFRGNIPYYDFPDFEEAVRDQCGKRETDKFEPLGGKGAVARATLYFLLRYPGQIGDASREMQKDRLPILLDWHRQNPPDEYERHRNLAIFDRQGNRNPLIDQPEWADRIDFSLGFD